MSERQQRHVSSHNVFGATGVTASLPLLVVHRKVTVKRVKPGDPIPTEEEADFW